LHRYKKDGNIEIADAKAHGLGYFYPPKDSGKGDNPENDWICQPWRWLLEGDVGKPDVTPTWFSIPVMMQITVSNPAVLRNMKTKSTIQNDTSILDFFTVTVRTKECIL